MNLGNKKNFSPIIPFIIILAIIISLSPTAISAQENATNSEIQNITETTADNIEINLEENSICENNSQECSFPPYKLSYSNEIKENNIPKKALLISDNPGTNILNDAACDILNTYKDVDIQVRSCNQICKMNENELYTLVETSDIVIINWLTSDADSVFTNLLLKYPNLSNKELFLFLETSSSSQAKNLHLVRNSTINHKKIFSDKSIYTEEFLNKYFSMTKRGQNYDVYYEYITNGDGKLVNAEFNKAVLYKNYNNKENQINEILWALNITGYECKYSDPRFSKTYEYGIFREQYMTLEEYKKKYFDSSRPYTVGLLESNMYVSNGQLQPYYALIKSLEAKGCNVIPVVAAGGSENQLKVMVKYFTNAPSYEAYLNNPLKYTNNVNAIISMPAYGIGGNLFDNTTKYFETAGVPVFRAVHSDYVSNEEWELSATGLPGNRSDKWWHVAIGEAQGIIEATFVGGVTHEISSKTGAQLSGFKAHEKNIDLFTKRIVSWINLQYTVNSDKKISLVYFNYPPGKQNIGSSYLDSITSVYNLLYELKSQGYNVGKLPTTVKELEDMMIKSGINVATWAPGELEKLSNQPDIVLLPVAEYENWFNSLEPISKVQVIEGPVAYIGQLARNAIAINYTSPMKDIINDWYNGVKSLLPENYTESGVMLLDKIVAALNKYLQSGNNSDYQEYLSLKSKWKALNIPGLNGWGEAPGNIMTVTKNGVAYFVIPGLKFGNIFIAPEPQRGWEAKSDLLYHSSAVAPTHQYLAAYYYMQKEYSSAMVFIGRHATHEWLPGKEVLLSTTDYGSIVVGDVPQIYFYISDGLGEGLEAKRRGFAVMITHLTSPLAYTSLYGNLTAIANLINKYENTTDKTQKDTIASNIKLLIEKNNYIQSMGLTREEFEKLNLNEVVKAADKFLFEVQNTLYPLGLHAIGQNWTVTDISRSVVAALSQEFTYDGITTTIFDEVAKYLFSKKYSELNALERDKVLNTSEQIVAALIFSNSTTVANVLGSDNPSLIATMNYARYYISLIYASINNELTSFINGLNGKYIPVVADGDVININSLPTGGNFFHDQSQELPTEEAYNYAKTLTLLTLSSLNEKTQKIAMGIWCVETARDNGALISVVLYLLGMQPVYTSSPSAGGKTEDGDSVGTKTKIMPKFVGLKDLVRPEGWAKKRIDVVVITSGNFRDLYSTQVSLLDNAFRVALARSYLTIINNKTLMESKYGKDMKEALNKVMEGIGYYGVGSESFDENYVARHWVNDFIYYKDLGYNNTYAGEVAITHVFAPPNGDYGAGIAKSVSLSWTWNNTNDLAKFYLGRMGNMYSKNYWGETNPVVFARVLNNTDDIIVSRNTNVYGVADNDDFFDYWGGLSMAVSYINGKTPNMNVLMYGNKDKPYISSIETVLSKETATRYFNPNWILGMMNEGYSGARYISNKFLNNLFGWAVTRPNAVNNWMWDESYNVYIKDKYNLGVTDWLQSGNNNYALISSAGTLLTAAYNGYWQTDKGTLENLATMWANSIIVNGVACCDCSCGNIAMLKWASQYINPDLLAKFNDQLYQATQNNIFANSFVPTNSNNPDSNEESQSSSKATSTTQSSIISYGGSNSQISSSIGIDSSQNPSSSSSEVSASEQESRKSYEVSKDTSSSSSTKGDMPISLIICVIVMVLIFGYGYYKRKNEE